MNSAEKSPTLPPSRKINPLHVIRDVVIIFILTALGGFILGIATRTIPDKNLVMIALGISNIIFTTIGFVIAGCLKVVHRWLHLFIVALCLWLLGLINVFFFNFSMLEWALGFIAILVAMGIGGGIASLLRR